MNGKDDDDDESSIKSISQSKNDGKDMTIGGDASRPIEILDVEMEEENNKIDGLIDVDKPQEIEEKDKEMTVTRNDIDGDPLNDPATTILLSAPDQEGGRTLVEDDSAPYESRNELADDDDEML